MKKNLYYLCCLILAAVSFACNDDHNENGYQTTELIVKLEYPESSITPAENVVVTLRNSVNNTEYDAKTNASGEAVFQIPSGTYEASATETRVDGTDVVVFNGVNSNVVVGNQPLSITLKLVASNSGSVIIKELYIGGCPDDEGGAGFNFDQSVVLYNNSPVTVDISDLAFAMVNPYNATSANKDYVNGELFYKNEGWTPAGMAVWHFNTQVELESGKQIVVNMCGAIDNTVTYSQSVNYANPDYYCFYDPSSGLSNTKYYPAPSSAIPTSHYLSAMVYGLGNAWPLSQVSPAFFLFRPEGTTLQAFVDDPNTTNNYGGSQVMGRKKVPNEWIVDGIEVFKAGESGALKRLTEAVDAGYIETTGRMGYTLYRNVDKAATEAIAGNKDKLVYQYSGGTEGSTDPSGIDAEASLKNGARIIYQDTNNSSKDFHQRAKSSLRN